MHTSHTLSAFPSFLQGLLDFLRLDIREDVIESLFRLQVKSPVREPQAEGGDDPLNRGLREELKPGVVAWEIGDLTALQIFDAVVQDFKLGSYI